MKHTPIRAALQSRDFGSGITVCGWVRTRRDSKGGFSFIELNDGSCFRNLQVVAPNTLANYSSQILKLYPGAGLTVTGARHLYFCGADAVFPISIAKTLPIKQKTQRDKQ